MGSEFHWPQAPREPEEIKYNTVMNFGKYKGKKLCEIPPDYFIFLHKTGKMGKYKDYIERNLEMFKKMVEKSQSKKK